MDAPTHRNNKHHHRTTNHSNNNNNNNVWFVRNSSAATIDERTAFASTIHAHEHGLVGQTRASHVHRPPTVLWKLDDVVALARLGRIPPHAKLPPGTSGNVTHITKPQTTGSPQRTAFDGCWYVPPFLSENLRDSTGPGGGYGCDHAAPAIIWSTNSAVLGPATAKGQNLARGKDLTHPQRSVIESQCPAYYNFPHRLGRILRNLRRTARNQRFQQLSAAAALPRGHFTIATLMHKLEQEMAHRLVYLHLSKSTHARPSTSDRRDTTAIRLVLSYALDRAGRYFACLEWPYLSCPTTACDLRVPSYTRQSDQSDQSDTTTSESRERQQQRLIPVVWWGNAIVTPQTRYRVFCYACNCNAT